jgi:hypothetical protein
MDSELDPNHHTLYHYQKLGRKQGAVFPFIKSKLLSNLSKQSAGSGLLLVVLIFIIHLSFASREPIEYGIAHSCFYHFRISRVFILNINYQEPVPSAGLGISRRALNSFQLNYLLTVAGSFTWFLISPLDSTSPPCSLNNCLDLEGTLYHSF